MKKILLYFFIFNSMVSIINAQTAYNMGNNGTVSNACGGNFYDSGGSSGKYGNNESYTETFCAPAGQYITFDFTSFATESGFDFLKVYNGPNTGSTLIGSYSGTTSPGSISSTLGGCLTFVFTSDNTTTKAGWTANISCSSTITPPTGGTSCDVSNPFCTGTPYSFPNTTGNTTGLGAIDCLYSTPNPVWYFMQIATSGTVTIGIGQTRTNGSAADVDFDCWGPFTSLASGCSSVAAGTAPSVDCSYSTSNTETCTINSAVAGQYYILLLTNYSNAAGTLSFSQSGGNGSTNCNVLCSMTGLTATPGACNPATGQYSVSGQITVNYPPTSGSLTVTSTCGGSVTIPTPWTSPISYTLTGLTANGAACSVNAGFSANTTCTLTEAYTAPPTCGTCSLTASNTGAYCVGQTISISATSTTSGTYAWTGPGGYTATGPTPTRTGATAAMSGTYTVVLTSGTGTCTATTNVTVNPNPTVTVNAATVCSGTSATFTANGASTYSWTPATGLSATTGSLVTSTSTSGITYSVTGTTSGCSQKTTAILTVNPLPTVSVNNPAICAGSVATISASGATSYTWSNGMTGSSISVTPTVTTSYTVTGGALGCTGTAIATVSVTNIPKLLVNDATICPGGTALLTASGASSYTWSTGATPTNTISVSPGSTQTYSVSGSIGSCISTTLSTVTIGSAVVVTVPSATICYGDAVTLTASGGTTYTWSPATGLNSTTTPSVSANPTSTQTYVITGASGTCTGTTTAVVTVNPKPTITVASATICAGSSTLLTANGASTYVWSPAIGLSSTTGTSVTANPTTTQAYTITGTSGAGCTNSVTAVVTVNPLPTVTVNNPTICTGGTAALTASGASSYAWSTGGGTSGISVSPTTTQVYTVTGTTNSCTSTATSTVTVVTTPTVTVPSATICIGSSTTLTASGASTYTWSPATGLSGTTGTSVIANPTSTTTYSITGTAGTCTANTTAMVTVNPLPVLSVNTPTICSGNASLLTASGASTYSWSTGATNTNTVSVSPFGNTSYTVTGTDANGCINSAVGTVSVSASVTVTVNDPIMCVGFTTTLTASGATSYSWNTGSTAQTITVSPTVTTSYTVTGSENGCAGTEFGTVTVVTNPTVTVSSATVCIGGSYTLTAMGASQYTWAPATGLSATTGSMVTASPTVTTTYTVVGAAGTCTTSGTGILTVNPLPSITATSGTICIGQQTATLTASGGVTYTWTPSTNLSPSTGTPVVASPSVTQAYTVTGTDANGCINTSTSMVTVNPLPTITVTSGSICIGQQTANLTASGATSYTWSPATGLGGTTGTSETANPSSTQTYTVTGMDINGCISTGTAIVTVNPLPNVTSTSTSVCPTFAGTLVANGASTYTWNVGPTGNTLTQTPTITTNYTVSGTDANTCTNTAVGTITVFPTLTVTVNSATICIGQQTATLTANGAANYSWGPSTGLAPTTGSIVTANPNVTTIYTVTGGVGTCTSTATSTVTVNSLPTIAVTSGVMCVGQQTVTLTASGGSTYAWSPNTGLNSTTSATVDGSPPATQTYVVTGTDVNGCVNTTSTIISVLSLPNVTATSVSVCPGAAGIITSSGANTYSWSAGPIGNVLTETPAATTNYTVTGTDTHNCYNTAVGTITVYNTFTISANDATICEAGQQTATLTANGASTYVWSPVAGINSNTGNVVYSIPSATSTVYTIIGTSAVGSCTATTTASLTVNSLPQPIASSNSPCVHEQPLNFTCTPTGLSSYIWTGPNSYTASGSNPSIPLSGVTPSTSGIYTVTVVDNNTPACTNKAVINVIVYDLPVVTASAAPVCAGQTINLVATGGVTYTWSGPNGYTATGPNQQFTADTSLRGNYIVNVIDGNTCTNAAGATVVVYTLPKITATTNAICVGQQTATLTASGASTYAWTGPSLSSLTTNPTYATPLASSIYNIQGTDINNCVSTGTIAVKVYPVPTATINPVSPDCIPYCPRFTAVNTSPTSTITAYNWNFGNGQSSNAISPSECFTVSGTSIVTLNITDANGCVNTATTSVVAFSLPTAAFNYGEQPVSDLAPEVQFINQSTPGINYVWNFGDMYHNIDSTINPSHTYGNGAGNYTVTLTAYSSNGCSATTQGIVEIHPDYVIYVPNAFTPNLDGRNEMFTAVGEGIVDYKMYIFDRWGNLIFYSEDITKGWDGTYQTKGGDVVQQDVYVWKIQLKNILNESKDLSGTVTLIK